jgi:hypothetical protein
VAFTSGGPLSPEEKTNLALQAWQQTSRFIPYRAGERALVITSGNGLSPLAIYVYDPDGNCVAKDDAVAARGSSDDLAVEWLPPEEGRYTIELRNFGYRTNRFDMITR